MIPSRGHRRTEYRDSHGNPYAVWEAIRVPRVPDEYLYSVVYLYDTEDHATRGVGSGGCGFLLGTPEDTENIASPPRHLYLVTCAHVARRSCVARLNDVNETKTVLPIKPSAWVYHDSYDVAACEIELNDKHAFKYLNANHVLPAKAFADGLIGPGDEVFMIGRYVNQEGQQRNTPVVRHGRIAMTPQEPIVVDGWGPQYAYMLEMHSTPGFSGSPVYLYVPIGSSRPDGTRAEIEVCRLLGIELASAIGTTPVLNSTKRDDKGQLKPHPHFVVPRNDCMSWALPTDIILHVLNKPRFVKRRDEEEAKRKSKAPNPIQLTGARPTPPRRRKEDPSQAAKRMIDVLAKRTER